MSFKFRLGRICKLIVFIASIICFNQQFLSVSKEYFNYNTIVNMKIEKILFFQLPAITACYPNFISIDKIMKQNN